MRESAIAGLCLPVISISYSGKAGRVSHVVSDQMRRMIGTYFSCVKVSIMSFEEDDAYF